MAKAAAQIQITGMKEVRKGLKAFSSDTTWRSALRGAYGEVSSLVEGKAQTKATASRMGSVARGSIKGKATTTTASIQAFSGVPWGPGFEFGSGGRFPQFPAKRQGGYHIYPAIDEARDEIVDTFGDAIDDALNREF